MNPDRTTFLGGTDVSALIGANPYKTPYSLYLEKTGQMPDVGETEPMRWGKLLEPVVASEFAASTGLDIEKAEFFRDRTHPFLGASPDYYVGGDGILEVKTSGNRQMWGPDGSGDVPEHYAIQALWYAGLTGRTGQIWIAALLGGQEMRTYRIAWDGELYGKLRELAVLFWKNHVEPRVPPESAPEDRVQLYERMDPDGATVEGTPEHERMILRLMELKPAIEAMEAERASIEAALKDAIGEHSVLRAGGFEACWSKGRAVSTVDWKGVAAALNAAPEIVDKFTKRGTTRRVFTVRRLQ